MVTLVRVVIKGKNVSDTIYDLVAKDKYKTKNFFYENAKLFLLLL